MPTDDARTRLLEAAGPVFADKGYQSATVRDICTAADVNVAAVNYYFGDKERLYIETVKQAHRLRLEQVPPPDWPDGTPAATRLHGFVRTLLARMIGDDGAPWQLRLMMREILQPTSACKELVQENFRPHFEVLLGIIDELVPRSTPLPKRHQIAFSIVGQCFYYRVAKEVVALLITGDELREHFTIDRLAEHIAELSMTGLGRDSGSATSASATSKKGRTRHGRK